MPQPPQLLALVLMLTSHPSDIMLLQSAKPVLQLLMQPPDTQVAVALAAAVQSLFVQQLALRMQLFECEHALCPVGQAQVPPAEGHVSPVTEQSLSVQHESGKSPPSGEPPSAPSMPRMQTEPQAR